MESAKKSRSFNSLTPIVPKWDALPEFRFKKKNGSLEKNSYERCVYESVDNRMLSYATYRIYIEKIISALKKVEVKIKNHAFVFGRT